jgi:hypothetical protein
VAGGCVGGMFVGGTDVFVGTALVLVGFRRVEVGCSVGGAEVRVTVVVRLGTLVRGVAVSGNVAVGVGVRVTDGVGVGIVEVGEGIAEGVCVGAVDVGKGPRSASEVSARAVLVLLALRGFRSLAATPNENQKNNSTPIIPANRLKALRSNRGFVKFTSKDFLSRGLQMLMVQTAP